MVKFHLVTLFIISVVTTAFAQKRIYVQYDANCMDRLEYRYSVQADFAGLITYSIRPNAQETYLFDIGNEGIDVVKSLPKGTLSCKNFEFNSDLIDKVNSGAAKLIFARASDKGYTLTPASLATQIVQNGNVYIYRSYNMEFSFDTQKLNYEDNLSSDASDCYVFFRGKSKLDCNNVYSFVREPRETCVAKTQFDFCPGIGVLSERSGLTSEELASNQLYVHAVNGVGSMEFSEAVCSGKRVAQPVVQPAPAPEPDVVAPVEDREVVSVKPAEKPVEFSAPSSRTRPQIICTEKPGEGYHIVQPGETLIGISRKYGVRLSAIIGWNNIKTPNLIEPCQKIFYVAPPPSKKTFTSTGEVAIAVQPVKKQAAPPLPAPVPAKAKAKPATYAAATKTKPVQKPVTYAATTKVKPVSKTTIKPAKKEAKSEAVVVVKTMKAPVEEEGPMLAARSAGDKKDFNASLVHIVEKGETVYGIAQKYGFTEDKMRKINGLSAKENIHPGQMLMTSDCTCDIAEYKKMKQKQVVENETSTVTARAVDVRPTEHSAATSSVFRETQVNIVNSEGEFRQPTSSTNNYHVVKGGETLGSIAKQYGITVRTLMDLNDLEATETLVAGQTVVVK